MADYELLGLREHLARLSILIGNPDYYTQIPTVSQNKWRGSWSLAADWLYISASTDSVEVNTLEYDHSIMWCGRAAEYENLRSDVLSLLTTSLIRFTFVWGSLETLINLLNLPRVPKNIKSGHSKIDDAIYYLKEEFEPAPRLMFYDAVLANFRERLSQSNFDSYHSEFKLKPYMGITGVGLHVVRKVRNEFAHGAMSMPWPTPGNSVDSMELNNVRTIETATRLIALSIQMLQLAYLKCMKLSICPSYDLLDEITADLFGFNKDDEVDIHVLLRSLHRRISESNY